MKKTADIVVGQRVCNPGPSALWQTMHKDGKKKLVYEIDDDLWNVHPSNEVASDFFNQPDIRRRLTENISVADVVTVTNDGLADIVRKYNDNIIILPNYIDQSLLTHERPRNEQLTIGWAGSATHAMDFAVASQQLRSFFSKNPDVGMHFIGCSYAQVLRLPRSTFTPWSMEVLDYQKSVDFDIGIAPLKYDVFNTSKSYIKALEYAALGIPVIASDIGPYRNFVKHGVTGFLVNHTWEWAKYLNILAHDEGLRKEMGEAGREQAKDYTMQDNAHKWLTAYSDLMEAE